MLAEAIESVLAQSFTDFELLIVDDGSTDGSADTIANFTRDDARVRPIRFETNVGLPALTTARAFCESTGECIAWMFDDCVWENDCMNKLVFALDRSPEAGVAYGRCRMRTASGDAILGEPLDKAKLNAGDNHIPNCATLIRRNLYETLGWPDPHVLLVRTSDWDFWTRASKHAPFVFVNDILATERGVGLEDSLGHTLSINVELMLRYAARERSAELHPTHWPTWRPFQAPLGLLQSDGEREDFLEMCLEHGARRASTAMVEDLRNDPELAALAPLLKDAGVAYAWASLRARKAAAFQSAPASALQQEIFRMQAFVDAQQAFIDRQQAFVDHCVAKGSVDASSPD